MWDWPLEGNEKEASQVLRWSLIAMSCEVAVADEFIVDEIF